MSNIIQKAKNLVGKDNHTESASQKNEEQQFSIQPHPAKSNDPADLQPHGGLRQGAGGAAEAFHARDPYIPSDEVKQNIPAGRDELRARQAEFN
ncbi:hypothetical protein CPB83DRAFT_560356 [Crepidotus variabilis]|uniref:Uncharacterized protein n=1 Tax=Crepidotus variabilis TaxID=179855 RepID=A0A9P6EAC3_9AGAR|nr:hypothetical protein CPB83DRAFT_560356 [Crepidotus variabilis]